MMHTMKVNLPQLMVEASRTCQSYAVNTGFIVANRVLRGIAQRACDLKDPELLALLEQIDYVEKVPKSS